MSGKHLTSFPRQSVTLNASRFPIDRQEDEENRERPSLRDYGIFCRVLSGLNYAGKDLNLT